MFIKNSILLLSILICFLSACSCGTVKVVKKSQFRTYSKICTNENLKAKLESICASLGGGGYGCVKHAYLQLKDDEGDGHIGNFLFNDIALCYDQNMKAEKCLSGYNKDNYGLVWTYSHTEIACIPEKSVKDLLK